MDTAVINGNNSAEVIDLLEQQRDLYGRLRGLANMQQELVENDNPELLLKVLANRQKIINQLALVDKQLKPIRNQWQEISAQFSALERQRVNILVDEVKKTIEEILSRDKADTDVLTAKKDQIATELKKVRTCRQMSNVYQNATGPNDSKYFDIGG